ncbi:MAG: hypothetical protein ABUL58_05165, partial [Steroidobacter sp.]
MRTLTAAITILMLMFLSGCASSQLGPRSIRPAEFGYNEAISRAWDEQLLLNLVRLRYRDNPLFVDVNSMTATYSMGSNTLLSAEKNGGASLDMTASAGAIFNHSPVISYNYLHGEQFAQRLLSPLAPSDLRILAQSGWSVERLLLYCYRSVNGVENAAAAAGPTPDYVPDYLQFQRIATLVRKLQLSKQMEWQYDAEGHTYVVLHSAPQDRDSDELRTLLSLDVNTDRFEIVPDHGSRQPGQMAVMGRSLLAVMYFLSLAVEVPDTDRQAGKVTITHDESGKEFE